MSCAPAWAGDGAYGAFAYDAKFDNVYVVTDKDTKDEAVNAALQECRKENTSCTVPLWFANACGALARDLDRQSWGSGWGDTQAVATEYAMTSCAKAGGKECKLKIVACSPGGASFAPPG